MPEYANLNLGFRDPDDDFTAYRAEQVDGERPLRARQLN
jgi:hypothetical protein